ncbi:unnamed protein product [Linum trigynum]|uniref:Transposase-associated domain-containing protein n=1 Tax=Linum trigynum TaxID=586398 RepID=A0AAV2EB85_9ROSI
MDMLWIAMPYNTPECVAGLEQFLDFAYAHNHGVEVILCPCPKGGFRKWLKGNEVYDHLMRKPFPICYTIWFRHGKSHGETSIAPTIVGDPTIVEDSSLNQLNALHDLINDAFGGFGKRVLPGGNDVEDPMDEDQTTIPVTNEEPQVRPRVLSTFKG